MTDISLDGRIGYAATDTYSAATRTQSRLGAGAVRAYFDSTTPGVGRLAFWGGFLTVVTLGIYRFWFTTHLRRQLWRRSALAGTNFEYTGTVREIFVGFLIMLAILLPIYGLAIVAQLQLGAVSDIANFAFLAALFYFIGFAMYRARRYRLTRTLWRGVRFGQTGSAAIYSLRSIGWTLLTMLTAGLVFPFFRASQERYRMNRTWFGDRAFTSKASGFAMLLPWILLLLVAFAPMALAIARLFSIGTIEDVEQIFSAFTLGRSSAGGTLEHIAAVTGALYLVIAAAIWAVIAPILLWPVYRAREIRSFTRRTTLGATRFQSDFSALSIYGTYIVFVLLAGVALAVVGGVSYVIVESSGGFDGMSPAGIATFAVSYLAIIWLIGAIKTRYVTMTLWGKLVGSIVVDGIEHLGDVTARRDQASAVGDDFASSYDFGAV